MYMATLGGSGFRELAQLNYDRSEYLKSALARAGFKLPFSRATFNEFVVEFPAGFQKTYQRLLKKKMIAGLPLDTYYPELKNHYLLCVTETITRADMDALAREIKNERSRRHHRIDI
jgi:glycine dehydrogenase subunit 1